MVEPILEDILRGGTKGVLDKNRFAIELFNELDRESADQTELPIAETLFWVTLKKSLTEPVPGFPAGTSVRLPRDCRVRSWMLRGVKGFGVPPVGGREQVWYGVDTAAAEGPRAGNTADSCASMIVFGNNGVGKSSLYLALELAFKGDSDLSRHRGITPDETERYSKFIRNIDSAEGDVRVCVDTNDRVLEYTLGSRPNTSVPGTFFCSEYDIAHLIRYGMDDDYIVGQIGLDRYRRLLVTLSIVVEKQRHFMKEWNLVTLFKKKIEIVEEAIACLERGDYDGFRQYAVKDRVIKKCIANNPEEEWPGIVNARLRYFQSHKARCDKELVAVKPLIPMDNGKWEGMISDVEKTYVWLNDAYKERISDICGSAEGIVRRVFSDFLERNESLEVRVAEKKGNLASLEVNLVVSDGRGEEHFVDYPQDYFNTFRFKLFCVTLKVALALSLYERWGIKAPVMIDDVFESSDFRHRVGVDVYIRSIVDSARNLTARYEGLQFLVFTQDELVAEGLYNGCVRGNTPVCLAKVLSGDTIRSLYFNPDRITTYMRLSCSDGKTRDYVPVTRNSRSYSKIYPDNGRNQK